MLKQALRKLYTKELQEEKRKDYRNVVTAQAALLVVSLLTDDLLKNPGVTFFLFQICCAVYLGLIWDLSRNFTFKRHIPMALGITSLGVVVASLVYNYFFWDPVNGVRFNCLLHAITVFVQTFVFWLGLRDLVRGPRNAADKLWAAAGLYIMLGIIFAEIIHVVHLVDPDSLGPGIAPTVTGFHEALYVSFAVLTGADNEVSGVSHFCRNVLVLESLLAQLYVVMLISRLLAGGNDGEEDDEPVSESGPESLAGPPADGPGCAIIGLTSDERLEESDDDNPCHRNIEPDWQGDPAELGMDVELAGKGQGEGDEDDRQDQNGETDMAEENQQVHRANPAQVLGKPGLPVQAMIGDIAYQKEA